MRAAKALASLCADLTELSLPADAIRVENLCLGPIDVLPQFT